MSGTPRYLTGKVPSVICKRLKIFSFSELERPAQKTVLFAGFAGLNPERDSKDLRSLLPEKSSPISCFIYFPFLLF
jgi:hypothetical protein